ncbi:MAG: hypothetical protein V4621_00025 [Pseudomonadota bacterium]
MTYFSRGLLPILALIILLFPVTARADKDDVLRYHAEAQAYDQSCRANVVQSTRYHCGCLAAYIYDARMRRDDRDVAIIIAEKSQNCVDKERIAGQNFQRCQQFPRQDKSSQLDFCVCYAKEMGELTRRYDDDMPLAIQRQMTMAQQRCMRLHPDRAR